MDWIFHVIKNSFFKLKFLLNFTFFKNRKNKDWD